MSKFHYPSFEANSSILWPVENHTLVGAVEQSKGVFASIARWFYMIAEYMGLYYVSLAELIEYFTIYISLSQAQPFRMWNLVSLFKETSWELESVTGKAQLALATMSAEKGHHTGNYHIYNQDRNDGHNPICNLLGYHNKSTEIPTANSRRISRNYTSSLAARKSVPSNPYLAWSGTSNFSFNAAASSSGSQAQHISCSGVSQVTISKLPE
jgi:hypothetical protein